MGIVAVRALASIYYESKARGFRLRR